MAAARTADPDRAAQKKIALEVLDLPTAPFAETAVLEYIDAFCRNRGIDCTVDRYGNRIAHYRYGRKPAGPPIGFAAHTDHPGFRFVAYTDKGRATARFLGGVPVEAFAGTPVAFFPPGRKRPVKGRVLEAVRDPEQGRGITAQIELGPGVNPGDPGMWDLPKPKYAKDRITARALDDLAGVIAQLALLDRLAREKVRADVWCVFTRAEEVGFVGAIGLALDVRESPQTAVLPSDIVLIAMEASSERAGAVMGAGPIVRVGDRRSIFDPAITRFLEKVAAAHRNDRPKFATQRKLMDGGTCETTAYSALGLRSGAVCVALGNYHNVTDEKTIGAEYISTADLANMVDFFRAILERRELLQTDPLDDVSRLRKNFATWHDELVPEG